MKDIGVLFLVEHIDRELDIVTCLMEKLESGYGVTSKARNYYRDFKDSLATLNPKVVVFPFFYGADHLQPIQYATRWPLARLVNLGWEQILNKLDVGMKRPRDDVSRGRVFHLCWTLEHRDFLTKNGVALDHLPLTGNPVMKLYDGPYRNYFKSREHLAKLYALDSNRKWVLFPESYQFAFYSDDDLKSLEVYQNADADLMDQAREYSERSLRQMLIWANELRDDNTIFILRPRPSTTRDQMVNFMHRTVPNPNANLKIIKTETVREWILAADHVISSHSTTLVEAALAGKPIHRFSPEDYPEALALEWHHLVPLLADRKSFLDAINNHVTEPTGASLAEWARAQFLLAGDPLDAITDSIARLFSMDHQAQSASAARRQEGPNVGGSWDDLDLGAPYDVFDEEDVASRRSRWKDVLEASAGTPESLTARLL
jgi:surface carbohydrate biosynthesis protein